MGKYRKKPVIIDAVYWDGSYKSTKEVIEFIGDKVDNDRVSKEKFYDYVCSCNSKGMFIKTLEGEIKASVGDWIIKGVKGEFYPCKPDVFKITYEKMEEL